MIYSGQILEYNGMQYYQVNKSVARRLFENKQPIAIQTSNMEFKNPWTPQIIATSKLIIDPELNIEAYRRLNFDNLVNYFKYYNCNYEQGYYVHFFKQITPES